MSTRLNHLRNEKSPYLLQHVENPVNWYPWGEEAFRLARESDRPVFLSVGYATCHWCHVMAHESFEDEAVAEILNRTFVCIKVDREERPDVDDLYMAVCQAINGTGGWPLTVLMTPEAHPFFAATYLPKNSRPGVPGMLQLLPRIAELWRDSRDALLKDAQTLVNYLRETARNAPGEQVGEGEIQLAEAQLTDRFDDQYGGFGDHPKFPAPHNLLFLLHRYRRTGDEKLLAMVERTLLGMRLGGIYDQVGFGFHRYATDRQWLVPHFEKMLYDQAMLMMAYSETWQITGKSLFRQTVEEIGAYVQRELRHSRGGFFSGEDADSEGEEGKYYLWSSEELERILGPDRGPLFREIFNVDPAGNYLDEARRVKTGGNILHLTQMPEALARENNLAPQSFRELLDNGLAQLLAARSRRIPPLKDDKILTDWNGLMIAAFAKAGRALGNADFINLAGDAAGFVLGELYGPEKGLLHRFREGEGKIPAFLDDYAFMIRGLLELHQATLTPSHFDAALALLRECLALFWDEDEGAFFLSSSQHDSLLVRRKVFYDGAIPSGNSMMMQNLLDIARLSGENSYELMAGRISACPGEALRQYPAGFAHLLNAAERTLSGSREVVLVGEWGNPGLKELREVLDRGHYPDTLVYWMDPAQNLSQYPPFMRAMKMLDGLPAAYLCRNFSCQNPVNSAAALEALLADDS